MRALRIITASLGAVCLAAAAGCGGSDAQPEMPNAATVDRSADDMGLPQAEGGEEEAGGEQGEASSDEEVEPPPSPVRVVAGENTAIEGASPTLRILAPRNDQRIASGSVMLRLQLARWELAADPGPHVHVIVDNEPYMAVRDLSQPIDLNALVQQNLGHELAPGTHVLRVFPSRGHHESVKTRGAFAAIVFHYGAPTEGFAFNPRAPLLTYSRPKGCNPASERVLLDFYASNVELAEDGFRVRYAIDDSVDGFITQWVPHWIEGMRQGEHTIRLQLVDAQGDVVPGPFNDTSRTIRVAARCP